MADMGAFLAGSIVGKLLLDKTGWNSAISAVQADEKKLTGNMGSIAAGAKTMGTIMTTAGAAIVGTLTGMAMHTANVAEQFLLLNMKTGISVEKLSAYKYVAEVVDTSIEDLGQAFKKMAMNQDDMATGSGAAGAALITLGVSAKDAHGNTKDMDTLLLDLADKFKDLPDGPQKSALAIDLFGRSGQNILPFLNQGREGITKLTNEAERFGLVMSKEAAEAADEFGDQLTALKLGLQGVGQQIGMAVMPMLTEFVLKAKEIGMAIGTWVKEHPELTRGIATTALAVGALLSVLGPVLLIVPKLIQGFVALKAAIAGISLVSAASTLAIAALVGGVIHYIGLLGELRRAEQYEIEAGERLAAAQGHLSDKLGEAAVAAGWQHGEMAKLIEKYHGNVAALGMAIYKGKEGVEIQKALAEVGREHVKVLEEETRKQEAAAKALEGKKAAAERAKQVEEEYASFLNSIGIYTITQQAEETTKVTRAKEELHRLLDAGKISLGVYQEAMAKLNEELKTYDMTQAKVLPGTRDMSEVLKGATAGFSGLGSTLPGVTAGFKDEWTWAGNLNNVIAKLGGITIPQMKAQLRDLLQQQNLVTMAWKAGTITGEQYTRLMEGLQAQIRSVGSAAQSAADATAPAVKEMSTEWDGLFNTVTQNLAGLIEDFAGGEMSITTMWNRLWKNARETFFTTIAQMASKFLVDLVKNAILGGAKTAVTAVGTIGKSVSDVGSVVSSAASGIGGTLASLGTGVASIIASIASAIGTGIAAIATGIGAAIVALATAIASAATILAAAAPALIVVGAIALALYAGFSAIGAILSSGGGGAGDGMGRVVERQDRFLAGWEWWHQDVISIMVYMQERLDIIVDRLGAMQGGFASDHLASIVEATRGTWNETEEIASLLSHLPHAQTGAVLREPTLLFAGEAAPRIPEIVLPADKLGTMLRVERGRGATNLNATFYISTVDDTGLRRIVRERIGPELVAWIRTNMGKEPMRAALGG